MMDFSLSKNLPRAAGMNYSIRNVESLLTPGLCIYEEVVERNIARTIRLLDGAPNRWRAHVKTAKLGQVMGMIRKSGVTAFKCATTLELRAVCEAGAEDVLVAYPVMGANAVRVRAIAKEFSGVRISALVDAEEHIGQWNGSGVGIFLDVNSGMNRTGAALQRVRELCGKVLDAKLEFRGLHFYDGHLREENLEARTKEAHRGYDGLLSVVESLRQSGIAVQEIVTCGTPAFPCALSYAPFRSGEFLHRVSPGTVVYGDMISEIQLPKTFGYERAALVVSRVVSKPLAGIVTCDAGHKSVSADSGIPNCEVWNWPNLIPGKPSEEHLPLAVPENTKSPKVGEILYLLPKHVCPTVNNFSKAYLIRDNAVARLEPVTAQGHEAGFAE